jgi:hypothetical protein
MPVGFPTKVNYATGDVLSAQNMSDLSGTVNLLTGTQNAAGKNPVLNSSFNVWQRGTSVSVAASVSSAYTADRWTLQTQANQASTVSRQATGDTTNLPNIQYCTRVQRNSGQTGTGTCYYGQAFESINSIPFAGKTVVLSFYARAGANYSPTSSVLQVQGASGTGTDQAPLIAWTGQSNFVDSVSATLTTTWQRFTYTGTVASTATQIKIAFIFTPTGTASTNDYFEVTGVQLEASTTAASAYSSNGSTYQAELAACQRYYVRFADSTTAFAPCGNAGISTSTTNSDFYITLPVSMRTKPSSVDFSTLRTYDAVAAAGYAISALTLSSVSQPTMALVSATMAIATSGRFVILQANNSTSAYLGFSAEL